MSVFLRWGVFGILAVAALVYVYNASKRIAEVRAPAASAASAAPGGDATASATAQPEPLEPACAEELRVAELALNARRENQPLDRLLRAQEIAFVSDARRRQRLEDVARKWFGRLGPDPAPEDLRTTVRDDCWKFSPAS